MRQKEETSKWILNELADMPQFAEDFRSYCEEVELGEDKTFELELSMEELIVNSFTHGYGEGQGGTVVVEAEDIGDEIKISLHDKAPPFDLFRDAPPPRLGGEDQELGQESELESEPETAPEIEKIEEKQGGLGIHLVRSLNDRVEYYGSKGGNVVVIIKSKT